MSTSPNAAAGAARQRIASVLGTLQQDSNAPPAILEIVSALASAMSPLFQLERDPSASPQLLLQARGLLQQTLERIQIVDQSYPGVADATGAIASSLGIIFQAMSAAGLVPNAPSEQQAAAPQRPAVAPAPAPQPQNLVAAPPAQQPAVQPQQHAAVPAGPQHAGASAQGGQHPSNTGGGSNTTSGGQRQSGALKAATVPQAPAASVPLGPNGVPRLESEIGVHSETNFYTDFVGDIRNHGGIFVATFHVLPIGAQCEVVVTFPGDLTAEIRGVVKWKRDSNPTALVGASPGLGIEITEAPPTAWNLIDRFMRKREPIMHEM